jgi:hypothetical protein
MRTGPRVSVQIHPDPLLGAGCLAAPASKETRMEQRSQELQLAAGAHGVPVAFASDPTRGETVTISDGFSAQ